MALFWLSFADGDLPKGSQFLGVSIVEGDTGLDAVMNSHRLNCNPGGEVLMTEIQGPVASEFMNRLMSEKELRAAGLI